MAEKVRTNWEELTPEVIDAFLEDRRDRGGSPASLDVYRRNLNKLYEYLPEDKRITAATGHEWKAWMEAQGVAPRSVNTCLSTLNSLSDFLGRREFQIHDFLEGPEIIQPELTRAEYLRLLNAAKKLGRERTYLIIKALGGAGLRIQELPQLTAEAVEAGSMELHYHNDRCRRLVRLPQALREELRDYIRREGVSSGPVFRVKGGKPISRTNVCGLLQSVSETARVNPEKATPRCLWNMYQSTWNTIFSSISILAAQAYDRMLEEEQQTAGWVD